MEKKPHGNPQDRVRFPAEALITVINYVSAKDGRGAYVNKQLLLAAELAISLAIVAALLLLVNVADVLGVIAHANIAFVLGAVLTYVLINVAMTIRIRLILAHMGHRIALLPAVTANFAGMLVSDFTPARSGYFATAFALAANHKIPLDKAVVSILGPQMFDFMVKVGAGTVAVIYLISILNLGAAGLAGILLGVAALASMLVFGVLLLFSKKFVALLSFIKKLPFGAKAYGLMHRMQENAVSVRALTPQIVALLAVTWALKGVEWWCIGEAVGMQPNVNVHPYVFYLFLQPLITLLQFIPTPTLAGMGVSEAGAVAVLAQFGVPAPVGAAFAILTRSLMVLVDLVGVNEARTVVRRNLAKLTAGEGAGWDE